MDFQVRGKGNHGFAASKHNPKKVRGQQKHAQVCKPLPRENLKKNSNLLSQANQLQKKFDSYPSWNVFNGGNRQPKNNNHIHQDFGKTEIQQYQPSYAKNDNKIQNRGYYSDLATRSTNATNTSDSDNNGQCSELSGFKIVQDGKTLYDETHEDMGEYFEEEYQGFGMGLYSSKSKFASSEMTMVPNFKTISIPLFLQA